MQHNTTVLCITRIQHCNIRKWCSSLQYILLKHIYYAAVLQCKIHCDVRGGNFQRILPPNLHFFLELQHHMNPEPLTNSILYQFRLDSFGSSSAIGKRFPDKRFTFDKKYALQNNTIKKYLECNKQEDQTVKG